MLENVTKMSKWICIIAFLNCLSLFNAELRLSIERQNINYDDDDIEVISNIVDGIAGVNLQLHCGIKGSGVFQSPQLTWGRRTKELKFKNEEDLKELARRNPMHIMQLINDSSLNFPYYYSSESKAYLNFYPLKVSNRGVYFCASVKYMLFKIIHIKVKEAYLDQPNTLAISECNKDKFQCVSSGFCIGLHYKCDGRADCIDGSDESEENCGPYACYDKILCRDGRCIPKWWCCDKYMDSNCTVNVRHSCCPSIQNPYDPMIFYHQNEYKETHRNSSSKYLFITICVISALLVFVLVLFVISRVCGFESKPSRRRTIHIHRPQLNNCTHTECAMSGNFATNATCLYNNTMPTENSDNNNEFVDPLIVFISNNVRENTDLPPSYSEVVNISSSMDKNSFDDLIDTPPPPYSIAKHYKTEYKPDNNVNASTLDQNVNCDINPASNYNV